MLVVAWRISVELEPKEEDWMVFLVLLPGW